MSEQRPIEPVEVIPTTGWLRLAIVVVLGALAGGSVWFARQSGAALPPWTAPLVEPWWACLLHGLWAAVLIYLILQGSLLLLLSRALGNEEWIQETLEKLRARLGLRQTESLLAEGVRLQAQSDRDRLDERWVLAVAVAWVVGCGWLVLAATAPGGPTDLGTLIPRLLACLVEFGSVLVGVPVLWWQARRLLERWVETTRRSMTSADKVQAAEPPVALAAVSAPADPGPDEEPAPVAQPQTKAQPQAKAQPSTAASKRPFSRDYKR